MSNMEKVEFIINYQGKNDLEVLVANDVRKRINDWMGSLNAHVEDDYIDGQIKYFEKFMKIPSIQK